MKSSLLTKSLNRVFLKVIFCFSVFERVGGFNKLFLLYSFSTLNKSWKHLTQTKPRWYKLLPSAHFFFYNSTEREEEKYKYH